MANFFGYATAWLFVCSLLVTPLYARAGVISFVAGLFAEEAAAQTDTPPLNSQNVALLAAAVNPDPNPAKGGGDITVVGGVALLAEAGPQGTLADIEETQNSAISLYVVREGDTLSGIAKMFGVTTNTIAWANDVSRGLIRPGQTLVILPISGVKHTVVKGDTLQSISKKYKADITEIAQYNHLAEHAKLAMGDMILAAAAGEVIIARTAGWNGGYGNYIVISHPNGTQTLYSHLSALAVTAGKSVVRGEIIGYMGSTGRSTGTHLHFEVRGAKNPF